MDNKLNVKVKYLNECCKITRATEGSVGYDFRANIDEVITLAPGTITKIPLGICSDLGDPDLSLLLFSRSGLSLKHGLMLINSVGVIDSDYRGEICACIYNTGAVGEFVVTPLMKICQGIFVKAANINIQVVDDLDETSRGSGGFNSTGII